MISEMAEPSMDGMGMWVGERLELPVNGTDDSPGGRVREAADAAPTVQGVKQSSPDDPVPPSPRPDPGEPLPDTIPSPPAPGRDDPLRDPIPTPPVPDPGRPRPLDRVSGMRWQRGESPPGRAAGEAHVLTEARQP